MLDRSPSPPPPSSPVPQPEPAPMPRDLLGDARLDDASVSAAVATARAAVERELAAFNGHNLDAVAEMFGPAARFITGHRGPPIEGPVGVRFYVADQYARFPGLALDLRSCTCAPCAPADGSIVPDYRQPPVRCHVRWRARWHDRDSGRLLRRDGGAEFLVADGLIAEVRMRPRNHVATEIELADHDA